MYQSIASNEACGRTKEFFSNNEVNEKSFHFEVTHSTSYKMQKNFQTKSLASTSGSICPTNIVFSS